MENQNDIHYGIERSQSATDAVEQLFGSKTRVRLLRLLLDNPEQSYFVREITRKIDVQLNSVRRELQNLIDIGIIKEVDNKIDLSTVAKEKRGSAKKKKYYSANTTFPFFEELRSIMKKSAIFMHDIFLKALLESGDINFVMLTGAFVDSKVPSDILIVGKIEPESLKLAVQAFEHEIGREINYTSMPLDEYQYRREIHDRFLMNLLEAEKVVLHDSLPRKNKKAAE
jgi:DNA-binding transcriptional ArsR family regulator